MDKEDSIITSYFHLGLQQSEILLYLALHHNTIISARTLKRILKRLSLYRRKRYSNIINLRAFIEQQVQKSGQLHGYKWMHLKCIQNGFVVQQTTVRLLLQIVDPIGVEIRKRKRLRRRQYYNKGPNCLWHMDSYDKLKPYGICINGCIDGFSRYIVWLHANCTSSDPKVVAGYFTSTVESLRGCPRRIRADMGTENGHVEQIHTFLRRNASGTSTNGCFLYGTSPANQRIEAWWSILRKHHAQFWMNFFQKVKDDGHFNGSFLDKSLIQFCFINLIQSELDLVVLEWNTHRISSSRNSSAPCGRPINMYELPQLYTTYDYIIQVQQEDIEVCKEECAFLKTPCDEDVCDLCHIIIEEQRLHLPDTPYEALDLYLILRNECYQLL